MASHTEIEAARTFRDIFDQSSELIYIHDREGVYLDVNQTVIDTYGYSKEEFLGNTPLMVSAPGLNDLDMIGTIVEEAWNKKETAPFEWWCRRKDGSIFLKEIKLKKGEYFGKEVLIVTGRDITERKKSEQELIKKSDQLRALNKELDSFMWRVSHDLKSPLSSIKGIVNVAKIEKNPDNIKDYFEHIEHSIDKLNVFIRGMEDMTRNKQREVNYAPIDFETLIQGVMEDFQFNNVSEGVIISKKIDQDAEFGSDSTLLRSVIHNLISNSYKYKADRNPTIDIRISTSDKEGIIEVEDNGIGISDEYLPKVFDMFFRASDKSDGSGIGLFIVKEALEKINGTIDVRSSEGIGTKFVITIPNSLTEIHN